MKRFLLLFFMFIFVAQNSIATEVSLSEQAVIMYNDNNLKGAMNLLSKIEETKKTPQDWLLLGNILYDQNKKEDAIFMYKRAILTDKKYYKAYYNIGNIYLEDEKFYMAADNFKKAIRYKQDFAYAHYNLGCTYIKLGELKKAKSSLLKAIELKNTEPDFHYNLAFVYKKLNKPKLGKKYLDFYNNLMQNSAS